MLQSIVVDISRCAGQ